jgi:hypothetical protein
MTILSFKESIYFFIELPFLIFLGYMSILSVLIGLSAIFRYLFEKKLTKKKTVIYAILQFVFFADLISSIIIYNKMKNRINIFC